ncbi:hypothetical protein MNBD_GAMMA06-1391 [hydrothermal vent metagenome]|uniref:Uncharacterized protein n=1 Tax=hydrothermal vent metagenome TaxID=652676 RepID=A0A3B0WQZ4_9ZZZZ
MSQNEDRTIMLNITKVIGILIAVMFTLIFVAGYIGKDL